MEEGGRIILALCGIVLPRKGSPHPMKSYSEGVMVLLRVHMQIRQQEGALRRGTPKSKRKRKRERERERENVLLHHRLSP
jgi:hypothetical protein